MIQRHGARVILGLGRAVLFNMYVMELGEVIRKYVHGIKYAVVRKDCSQE